MQKWGKDIEPLAAGFQFLAPWYRVAYLVTKQSCNYTAPIKEAPTADNVKIGVDVHFNFMILNPRDFVYKLGAVKFDELLHSAAEEAIRMAVRETPIDRVYELRGSQAGKLLATVNTKFEEFGVQFSQANITSVRIPGDLRASLHQATLYDSKLSEQQKSQDYRMDQLRKDAEKLQIDTNNRNTLMLNDMRATLTRLKITNDDQAVKAETEATIATTKAREWAHKAVKASEGDLYSSQTKAEQQKHTKVHAALAQVSADKVTTEQKAREMVSWSEAELAASEQEAAALLAEAAAEAKAAEDFKDMRHFELQGTRLQHMKKLATKSRLVFTGENGDAILRGVMQSATLVVGKESE